ncbi:hypothetical protein U9M48_036405 [Paspalum notatum var. saurae]|uniref:Uncharacterized protein n=1 Tax=Paspalum notatum var. saurae TaxID=547442 RepID=A0AAQ3X8X4_PASNO
MVRGGGGKLWCGDRKRNDGAATTLSALCFSTDSNKQQQQLLPLSIAPPLPTPAATRLLPLRSFTLEPASTLPPPSG